ncbi:DUF433 domain-containing protein [Methylocystis rosea]|jgi:uncharacterized protein (DUF433 family)|uniref:DUF433 domain-containing protein n=1 Tax=Methylocystis rosea TaxID=173366 RepID=UPI0018A6C4C4|nr:DUF433 domain-containing protein [Methylocystis rosea]
MDGKDFGNLIAGLDDALAYAKGHKSPGARAHPIRSENRAWDDADVRDAWIESIPEIKGGAPVIKGTRITAYAIEARLLHGDSLDEIAAENPDIPREAFVAALLFAKAHPLPR